MDAIPPDSICSITGFAFTLLGTRRACGEGDGTPLQYSCWKIPWTEEPDRLQSMRSLGVGHDWATSLSLFTFMHWRRKWQSIPVFLLGESRDRGAWWAAVYGVAQSQTQLKRLSSSSSRRALRRKGSFLLMDGKKAFHFETFQIIPHRKLLSLYPYWSLPLPG